MVAQFSCTERPLVMKKGVSRLVSSVTSFLSYQSHLFIMCSPGFSQRQGEKREERGEGRRVEEENEERER